MRGHDPVPIVSLATALQHIQSGQLRVLTIFDTKRYAKLPDVPTISEVLPNYQPGRAWVGFLGPADLPAPITARLHDEIVGILTSPDVLQVLSENGLEPIANSPAEFATMIKQDSMIWYVVAAIAGPVSAP